MTAPEWLTASKLSPNSNTFFFTGTCIGFASEAPGSSQNEKQEKNYSEYVWKEVLLN